jgi:PmbA protein
MSTTLLERAKQAVATATKRGAQGVRAAATRSRESTVEYRDGKLDRVRESTRLSLFVTLFVDGRYSASSTSDLRPAAVERFLAEGIAQTRLLARDPARGLADPARYAGRSPADLRLHDGAVLTVTPDHRRRAVQELEAAARAKTTTDRIVAVQSTWTDDVSEGALVCSNGMEGTTARTACGYSAAVTVRDQGGRKPAGYWSSWTRHLAAGASFASVGAEATRRALLQVGAKPGKTGEYACVVENSVAGRLIAALLGPLGGAAIQQKQSFLAGKIGRPVASPILTISDDPHVPAGLGSRSYDGEGMATRRRAIIEKGVLRSYYLDTYYARKLKLEPTSGGHTNLVFATGKRDLAGLLRELQGGILVTGFIGGNSNSATGDFSFGVRGLLVEKGQPTRPVAEMNLSGNLLAFFQRLVETGNDPFPYSSTRCPSLRFDKVQFSGV